MRLSKIKLAGFKSFVDPTTITLPSNLVGIVGPNGCGKSNVIDAVRWVMGESSAKHLRGDSMADVIFNGSASRKPVGAATIELFFDNADGSIGGQYAQYAEISIKRALSRDGTSLYFLNNVRCRRKDITDIFLGTGLGSRSYAIIEQGMVSRLIEAKPDELRSYVEEAAGISKYKERRRETETRIGHTRDNLARLNDLREEIARQLEYLQKQAKTAERYRELKRQERRLEAELLAIRLAELDRGLAGGHSDLTRRQTDLESAIAEQRRLEAEITAARERHVEATEVFNRTQARYYGAQSEISRLEQAIAHARELRERQLGDLTHTREQMTQLGVEVDRDRAQLGDLEASVQRLTPELEETRQAETAALEALRRAETALETWQDTWHGFNLDLKEFQQTGRVEQTRIEHLEAQLATLRRQEEALDREQAGILLKELDSRLSEQATAEQQTDRRLGDLTARLAELDLETEGLRERERALGAELEKFAAELASRRGQLVALQAAQRAALGADDDALGTWLARHHLADAPRLAQRLRVEEPWLLAVETVLSDFLQAVCVPECSEHLRDLPETSLTLLEAGEEETAGRDTPSLLSKVGRAGRAAGVLASVRVADSLAEAVRIRKKLAANESVITSDGIWLGDGWVRVSRRRQTSGGVLSREQDIRALEEDIREHERRIAALEKDRHGGRSRLAELEQLRADVSAEFNAVNRGHAEAVTVLENLRQERARASERRVTLDQDAQRIGNEITALVTSLDGARRRLEESGTAVSALGEQRPRLQRQQKQMLDDYNTAREQADQARERVGRINVEVESRRVSRDSATTSLGRVTAQRQQLVERAAELDRELAAGEAPLAALQSELAGHLEDKLGVERSFTGCREELELVENQLRSAESRRAAAEKAVAGVREVAEALRMQVREGEVRREGLLEQFAAIGATPAEAGRELPADADVARWQENLDGVRRRIERLGAINLAAIEQFNEQSERKTYLDAQHADLTAALETLEQAIRKIDRESRSRFQETFDNINQGLKRIFPRLFGGGHAYLSLEGEEILSAGVTVMARPPGKRNSNIHLLSGGEKALTAVALIFSIFELNPAPFCLLDEVDAPLDDANVGRFCDIVREMSQRVQFMVITHNKTTMEMTRQLTGVTMNEPGVSRLVSVDLDEAVQLAAS